MALDRTTLADYAQRFKEALTSKGGLRAAAAGLAMLGIGAAASFPAAADQATALTSGQCENAIKIANGIVQSHRGEISTDLRDSFVRFSKSNCDLNTDWKLRGKADETVFGEFRLHLIVMRKADAGRPTFARN